MCRICVYIYVLTTMVEGHERFAECNSKFVIPACFWFYYLLVYPIGIININYIDCLLFAY